MLGVFISIRKERINGGRERWREEMKKANLVLLLP